MAQPAKFDFGNVFDGIGPNADEYQDNREPTWNEAEVEEEKAAAFAAGREAGKAEALAGIEQRIATSVQQVLERAQKIAAGLKSVEERLNAEAEMLSIATAQAIASELLVQSYRDEIESIVSEALGFLTHQPHVVIRVHEDLLEGSKTRFQEIADARAFTGKLIILGEPDLAQSDCRIEWAEGGIIRDGEALSSRLDEIVQRHLSPESLLPEQEDFFTYMSDTGTRVPETLEETAE